MTTSVPPPVPSSNKTNVGVLKALLIFGVIVAVLGMIALKFLQDRADARRLRYETQQDAQRTQEMVRHSQELRERCRRTGDC